MSSTRTAIHWCSRGMNSTPDAMNSTWSGIHWCLSRIHSTPSAINSTRDAMNAPKRGVHCTRSPIHWCWSAIGPLRWPTALTRLALPSARPDKIACALDVRHRGPIVCMSQRRGDRMRVLSGSTAINQFPSSTFQSLPDAANSRRNSQREVSNRSNDRSEALEGVAFRRGYTEVPLQMLEPLRGGVALRLDWVAPRDQVVIDQITFYARAKEAGQRESGARRCFRAFEAAWLRVGSQFVDFLSASQVKFKPISGHGCVAILRISRSQCARPPANAHFPTAYTRYPRDVHLSRDRAALAATD